MADFGIRLDAPRYAPIDTLPPMRQNPSGGASSD